MSMSSERPPNPGLKRFIQLMERSLEKSIQGKVRCSICDKVLTPFDVQDLVFAYPLNELEPFIELMFLHTFYGICSKKCATEFKEVHDDEIRKRDI